MYWNLWLKNHQTLPNSHQYYQIILNQMLQNNNIYLSHVNIIYDYFEKQKMNNDVQMSL